MEQPICIFSSHYSIGDSILTVDEYEDEEPIIKDTKPVNIFAIAKKYNLERVIISETEMGGFWEVYKTSKSKKIPFIFGVKFSVCDNAESEEADSVLTESNVIVFIKNTQGYYDFLKILNKASTLSNQRRRISWEALSELMTENLQLTFPFYSSFLAKNSLYVNYRCFPRISNCEPIFFLQSHGLPFDEVLRNQVINYCETNNYKTQEAHQVYYYKDSDCIPYQVLKCLKNRSVKIGSLPSLREPKLDHFGSDQFSFESYLKKSGKEIIQ